MEEQRKSSILGTFEGECADANITNLNGLDITREVWETVFASDEYKRGIENSWFLGYLGHPEDPGCQEFEHACIIMNEGHIDDKGKVYGKFTLVDTPVGRIVKSFQDAGVQFGISVRGAGDIYDNSVDPETFVFRGFDLVAFPAYPESIPQFTPVAASSDLESQRKYKIMCSAVIDNIEDLDIPAINEIEPYFAEQSEARLQLEAKKLELEQSLDNLAESLEEAEEALDEVTEAITETEAPVDTSNEEIPVGEIPVEELEELHKEESLNEQISDAIDNAIEEVLEHHETDEMVEDAIEHTEAVEEIAEQLENEYDIRDNKIDALTDMYLECSKENKELKSVIASLQEYKDTAERKFKSIERITSTQMKDLDSELSSITSERNTLIKANKDLERSLHKIEVSKSRLETNNKKYIKENKDLNIRLEKLQKTNLKYSQKIESTQNSINSKDSLIDDLQSKLDETVREITASANIASNREEEIKRLKKQLVKANKLVAEYQEAYANLYSSAVGVDLNKISVTSSTSVTELQSSINSSVNLNSNRYSAPTPVDVLEIYDDEDSLISV